jgi:hypothetical protein
MGMVWKKNNIGVNFAPAGTQITLRNLASFGVCKETPLDEFGASITAYYKFNLMTNVSIENRLTYNYLDNPENVDIDYQMNVARSQ